MSQSKISLKKKIWFLAIFQMLNLSFVGLIGWYFNEKQVVAIKDFNTKNIPAVRHIKSLDNRHDEIENQVLMALSLPSGAKEKRAELLKQFTITTDELKNELNGLSKINLDSLILTEVEKLKDNALDFVNQSVEIMNLVKEENYTEAHKKSDVFEKTSELLTAKVINLDEMIEKSVDEDVTSALKNGEQANQISFAIIFVGLAIGLFFSYITIQYVVSHLTTALKQIADESAELNQISTLMHTASQDLSQATTEQAAAIEETVASSEEMASMLSQTAQHSNKSLHETEEGRNESQRGLQVMHRLGLAMEDIQHTNEKLESLVRLIDEIKSKTKVINDIVFETRLLSFNASIEAARAGVHGKGFAVVAEEVGKLATMSGKAADEIRTLLDSSTTEVAHIVRNTQEKVTVGKTVSTECQTAFQSMGDSLLKINESVTKIASATKEQEVGIKQTNRAMAELDKVTNNNSQASEKLAAHSDKLYRASRAMDVTMKNLNQLVFGLDRYANIGSTDVKVEDNIMINNKKASKGKYFFKNKQKITVNKSEDLNSEVVAQKNSDLQLDDSKSSFNKQSDESVPVESATIESPTRSAFKWKKTS